MEKTVLTEAYACLARKQMTEHELTEKLKKKGYTFEDLAPYLDDLRGLGYLRDDEVIMQEVRRAQVMGRGPQWAASRLALRLGCDFYGAGQIVEERYSEHDQLESAKALIEKKRPTREKLAQLLRSRGFSSSVLQHFLSIDISD